MIQSEQFLQYFKVDVQRGPLRPQMTQSILVWMVKIGHEMVESAASWESARQLCNGAMLGHFSLCFFLPFIEFDDVFGL